MLSSEKYKGHTIELHSDGDATNPRKEWDNLTEMLCFHSRYDLGDEHDYELSPHADWGMRQDFLFDPDPAECTAAAWLPLYLLDHSGLTMNTTGFGCGWDSGQVGFIRITKEVAAEHYPERTVEQLEEILVADVKVYDTYLRGEVVGHVIKDGAGEEIADGCCWGFYGHEDAIESAKETIDYLWDRQHELFTRVGVEVEA